MAHWRDLVAQVLTETPENGSRGVLSVSVSSHRQNLPQENGGNPRVSEPSEVLSVSSVLSSASLVRDSKITTIYSSISTHATASDGGYNGAHEAIAAPTQTHPQKPTKPTKLKEGPEPQENRQKSDEGFVGANFHKPTKPPQRDLWRGLVPDYHLVLAAQQTHCRDASGAWREMTAAERKAARTALWEAWIECGAEPPLDSVEAWTPDMPSNQKEGV